MQVYESILSFVLCWKLYLEPDAHYTCTLTLISTKSGLNNFKARFHVLLVTIAMKVAPVGGRDMDLIVAMAPSYHECCVLSSTGIEGLLPLSAIDLQSTV